MEIVISVVAKIAEYLVEPVKRQIDYLRSYKSNIEDFRNQVKTLEGLRTGVQRQVDADERNAELLLPNVQEWLKNVDEITAMATEFSVEKLQGNNERCFNDRCPNLKSRYNQSKKAKKNKEFAAKLKEEGDKFNTVSSPAPPPTIGTTSNEDVEVFDSRKSVLNDIMTAIKDDQINMIGIYGMGGVGKTTLVREVGKRVKDDNIFEEIVMAVVSQSPDLRKIQGEIADMLGLKFEVESVSGRAARLCERLKQKKRVLVVLDDIWDYINLEDIGIPYGERNNGCKILLTSRRQNVCRQMSTQKDVSVEVLSEEEAWNLFRKMAGSSVDSSDLHSVASKVVKECAGLPIAIVTVARALKDKNLYTWNVAANRLQKSIPISDKEKVFSTLELSYDYLPSEEVKSFFLLCCIFGEDHNIAIEDLWKIGMGLELFKGADTVEDARDSAYTLADTLKDSCLLQEGRNKDSVKMHDVVRDFAISIAARVDHGFLVRSGPKWKEFSESNEIKRYKTISLISDAIQKLPVDRLECPKLEFLYLECRYAFLQVPENFFSGMKKLRVLVLSLMNFSPLPSSLVDLGNLQTLCLDMCNLCDLTILGKLKELRVLSLVVSFDLEELPKEIGQLTNLRLLDLSRCGRLRIIPRDVIMGLSRLEGLYMANRYAFMKWEIERQDQERRNVSLGDLKNLCSLITLKICVRDIRCLPADDDLLFEKLSRFQICLGNHYSEKKHFLYSRALTLRSLKTPLNLLRSPLKKAEYVHMERIDGVYEFDQESISSLKCLVVKECEKMEYIFHQKEPLRCSNLEKLNLEDLPNLKEIYHGQLPCDFFRELQNLKLTKLPGLVNTKEALFDEKVVFPALENLELFSIDNVKELWPQQTPAYFFPQLKVVKVECCHLLNVGRLHMLSKLPKLKVLDVEECNSVEKLNPEDVPNLKEIHHCQLPSDIFRELQNLKLTKLPGLVNIWKDPAPHVCFRNLQVVQVTECNGLKYLFSHSMVQNLSKLTELSVIGCKLMEEIIGSEAEVPAVDFIILPGMQSMRLECLPNLKRFCSKLGPNTKEALFDEKVIFPVLERLEINNVHNIKEIWPPKIPNNSFSQLKFLEVVDCHRLLKVAPFNLLRCLEEIFVRDCDSVEVIGFQGIVVEGEDIDSTGTLLYHLRKLKFYSLPKLKDVMEWDKYPNGMGFFQNLTCIDIYECNILKSVLPPSIAKSLLQLQEVEINSCELMETIITKQVEGEENFSGFFPKLQSLILLRLPNLTCFHATELNWSSLTTLAIRSCPTMKTFTSSITQRPFFDSKVTFTNLEELNILDMENVDEIFDNQRSDECFCQLRLLIVKRCNRISRLASSNILPRLKHLKVLEVEECNSIEVIFEGMVMETQTTSQLSQLRRLCLIYLPNLRVFCSGNYALECPSLNWVELVRCWEMHTFSSSISTPRLYYVRRDFECLWEGDLNTTVQHIFHKKNKSAIKGGEAKDGGIVAREEDIPGGTPDLGQDANVNPDEPPCEPERISSEAKAKEDASAVESGDASAVESARLSSNTPMEENLQAPEMGMVNDSVAHAIALEDQNVELSGIGDHKRLAFGGEASWPSELSGSMDVVPRGIVQGHESLEEKRKVGDAVQSFVPLTEMATNTRVGRFIDAHMNQSQLDPNEMVSSHAEYDRDLLRQRKQRSANLLARGYHRRRPRSTVAVVRRRPPNAATTAFVFGCLMLFLIFFWAFASRTLVSKMNTQYDPSNDALMSKHYQNHLHPNEMVVSRAEFESLQRDQELLRQRAQTLEELLINAYPRRATMGLNMTLDVGWVVFSFLLLIFITLRTWK